MDTYLKYMKRENEKYKENDNFSQGKNRRNKKKKKKFYLLGINSQLGDLKNFFHKRQQKIQRDSLRINQHHQ